MGAGTFVAPGFQMFLFMRLQLPTVYSPWFLNSRVLGLNSILKLCSLMGFTLQFMPNVTLQVTAQKGWCLINFSVIFFVKIIGLKKSRAVGIQNENWDFPGIFQRHKQL